MDYAAIIIAAISLALAIWTFLTNREWKKLEFVGQEIRHFRQNTANQCAMKMLDWNAAKFRHPDIYKDGNPVRLMITDKEILRGLGPINQDGRYSEEEKFVRDCFDAFFDSLEVLETHVEQGLVSFDRYEPYLRYYVDIMMDEGNTRKSAEIRHALQEHMRVFGYDKAERFCKRFG